MSGDVGQPPACRVQAIGPLLFRPARAYSRPLLRSPLLAARRRPAKFAPLWPEDGAALLAPGQRRARLKCACANARGLRSKPIGTWPVLARPPSMRHTDL
jgi:hypothetical protein